MGTGSRYLHDHIKEGDQITIGAPAGRFCFDGQRQHVVFIAGGVGITPMMSMARHLTDSCWTGTIDFIVVTRSLDQFIFHQELETLAQRHPNLRLRNTLTAKTASPNWTGETGYLDEPKLRRWIPETSSPVYFICGPDAMMQSTQQLLTQVGVPESQVYLEAFVSPSNSQAMAGHSGTVATVTAIESTDGLLDFVQSKLQIPTDRSVTILEAAEEAGVELPFECRSGVCGQCKVKCLTGQVTMDARDALSSKEEAAGWVLACQARIATAQVSFDA